MAKSSNQKPPFKKGTSIENKQRLPLVKECTIEFFYFDEGAEVDVDGEVRFDDARIVVSYETEDGCHVVYQGFEKGKGHYELRAPAVNGKATLHMFEKSNILEGFWFEQDDDLRGMWRIRLI